jgi:raffinose/stachyose/melibiose transport system permease protein
MDYAGEFSTEWNKILAFITLTLVPAVVFFLVAQRQIIAGLTSGAVKG